VPIDGEADIALFDSHVKSIYSKCAHHSMLRELLRIMGDTLSVSGTHDSKRQRTDQQKLVQTLYDNSMSNRVVKARFALGGDDGAYLRANVMPLQTVHQSSDAVPLRVGTNLTHEMQTASYRGLLNAFDSQSKQTLGLHKDTLAAVWTTACWLLSVDEVYAFVKEHVDHGKDGTCDECVVAATETLLRDARTLSYYPEFSDEGTVNALKTLLEALASMFSDNVMSEVTKRIGKPSRVATNVAKALMTVADEFVNGESAFDKAKRGEQLKELLKAHAGAPTDETKAWRLAAYQMTGYQQQDFITTAAPAAAPSASGMLAGLLSMSSGAAPEAAPAATPAAAPAAAPVPLTPAAIRAYHTWDDDTALTDFAQKQRQAPARDPYVSYALARGLCGRSAAHQLPVSEGLLYSLPSVRCPTMEQVSTALCDSIRSTVAHESLPQYDHYAVIDMTDDFCYFGEQEYVQRATWAPVVSNGATDELRRDDGEDAAAVACASVAEHLVSHYNKLATPPPGASVSITKTAHSHRAYAACAKVHQLDWLAHIFAIDRNRRESLCKVKHLQTVPVRTALNDDGVLVKDKVLYACNPGLLRVADGTARALLSSEDEARKNANLVVIPGTENTLHVGMPQIKATDPEPIVELRPDPPQYTLPRDELHRSALSPGNLKEVIRVGISVCKERIAAITDRKNTETARAALEGIERKGLEYDMELRKRLSETRREEVWNDSMREAAISGDRLYAFIRQLSGTIHESVDAVCVVDESMLVQQQKERQANSKRLAALASEQHMQIVSKVFQSVISGSGLTLGIDDKAGLNGELKVVSNSLRKQVSDLASGSSSREGFFTNSVRLEGLLAQGTGEMTLNSLFARLRDVGVALQEAALSDTDSVDQAAPSLDFLSSPRNSLILRYKPEAHAAIRQAFDVFSREMSARHAALGMWPHRKISAFEMIEGRDDELSMAFATYAAHTLAHQRMFSASQAAYISAWASRANAAALKYSLDKLVNVACRYVNENDRPSFLSREGWARYFGM
jgi:hypothetical protein